ncbi:MAG: ribosome silencing factor [Nitrospirota bacterium]|nr:ribosome silencing factor [Nitrospirota bacterium]
MNPIYSNNTCINRRRRPIALESKVKSLIIAQASLDKKADDVLILHVAPLTSIADYLVLCSADSDRQVRAIADNIEKALAEQHIRPLSLEGLSISQWVAMDFGDVIVHIFRTDLRQVYMLERLWGDAKRVKIPTERVAVLPEPVQTTKKRPARRAAKSQ